MAIRILIADDHSVVRQGLKMFLGLDPELDVVGEAENGLEALRMARELRPDVVLMDLLMPEMDGIAATAAIRAELPGVEVVALTSFVEEARVTAALEAGAAGFILKDADADDVAEAIRAAHRGEVHLDPAVASIVARGVRERVAGTTSGDEPLTSREHEVLGLVARGLSNREIAGRLAITERTARTHVSNILGKLGLASRTQAALYAVEHGLVPPA
jgi:two-component system, NarL family, response regulator LiaR